jgi:uncharacterized protein (DUF885 family)
MTKSLYQSYFKELLDLAPSFGSFLGYRKYDCCLEDTYSKENLKKSRNLVRKYQKLISKLSSQQERFDIDELLLKSSLKNAMVMDKYKWEYLPYTSYENVIVSFPFLQKTLYETKYDTDESVLKLISRHRDMSRSILTNLDNMRKGMSKGYTLPKMICQNMIDNLDTFIKRRNYLVPIKASPDVTRKYNKFMEEEYAPVLDMLLAFLKELYLPNCRKSIGLCGLPKGQEMYSAVLKRYLTQEETPESVHAFGMAEVRRIRNQIRKLNKKDDLNVNTFIKKMKHSTKYKFSSGKEIVSAFQRARKMIRRELLPDKFGSNLANTLVPYELHSVPKEMEQTSAAAFYYPPAMKGLRPGRVFLNVRNPKEVRTFNVLPLSLHEGEPGHHLQFEYMRKLPEYRVYGAETTAFSEGWALYTETFVHDLVDKKKATFEDLFGRYCYEIFRAVRLVVDTGIHYYGWSYNKALKYMIRYVPLSTSELKTELERYICSPGQALCYKMGERLFLQLRERYLKAVPGATIQDFHRIVLEDGALPMNVLKKKVEYIIHQKRA